MIEFRKYLNKHKEKNVLYTLLYAVFSKKYHWYEVRYVYTIKGIKQFDWVTQVGFVDKEITLNRRRVKKQTQPLHLRKGVKNLLRNGKLDVEFMCYLGRFPNGI